LAATTTAQQNQDTTMPPSPPTTKTPTTKTPVTTSQPSINKSSCLKPQTKLHAYKLSHHIPTAHNMFTGSRFGSAITHHLSLSAVCLLSKSNENQMKIKIKRKLNQTANRFELDIVTFSLS
jgi:hypothetical protein